MTAAALSPRDNYLQRLEQQRDAEQRELRQDNQVATARGVLFLAALALVWLAVAGTLSWWALLPVAPGFVALMIFHSRVIQRLKQTRLVIRHYQESLARLEHRWQTLGVTGERYRDHRHVYSGDLDLFGTGSVFQLLCSARTRLGEDCLARWLSEPAGADVVRARQAAVRDFAPAVDLREELALLDAEVHDELDQNLLKHWAEIPACRLTPQQRLGVGALAVANLVTLAGWLLLGLPKAYFLAVLMVQIVTMFTFRRLIRETLQAVDRAGSGLAILSQVLQVMERQSGRSPLWLRIQQQLQTGGHPPSWQIARLHRLIQSLLNSLQNQFFAPLAFLLGLPVHLVHAIEVWREDVGRHVPEWLAAVGEFEAVMSLSRYAYEHPGDVWPEPLEGEFTVAAEQVGHPLLPESGCVRNSIRLGDDLRLMLVSGSNMSGKSTLLRTLGTSLVLAMAGAPVRATRFRFSPMQPGTAMRVQDSLQEGQSFFYAEIRRLKQIVELIDRPFPLLFLFDEILQGTNSHDRRVGAQGIIRSLVSQGAMGLVTTHDLELTRIVEELDHPAVNVHFEDRLVRGQMHFDYRLRDGVVQRSNALELMRMVGLQVANSPAGSGQATAEKP